MHVFIGPQNQTNLGGLTKHLVQRDELQAGKHLNKLTERLQLDSVTTHQSEIHQPAPA